MLKKLKLYISDETKAALAYLIASVVSKGLVVLTIPIYTRLMSTEQIGIVNIFTSWYAILGGVFSLGLTSGGLMLGLNNYKDKQEEYLSTIMFLTTLGGGVFGVLLVCFTKLICDITKLPLSLTILMFFAFVFCPATDFWIAKQKYNNKYKLSSLILILSSFCSLGVAIIAVKKVAIYPEIKQSEAWLYGTYIIMIVFSMVIWLTIMCKGRRVINISYWKYSLTLSIPLIGQMIAAQILSFSDRIMIERFCGESKVGIYSTIYVVGTASTMVWGAINGAFTPYIYKNIENNKAGIKESSIKIIVSLSVISFLIVLVGPEITKIIGTSEYYEGMAIIPFVSAGVYLIAIGDIYSDFLIYLKKTYFIMIGTMIGAVINVILNYIFIPIYGYTVAAKTTLIAYLCMVVFFIVICNVLSFRESFELNKIADQKIIIFISVFTIVLDLLLITLYDKIVIRFVLLLCLIVFVFCRVLKKPV